MKVLDSNIDNAPSVDDIKELAELRIRNLLCFRELKTFNDTGVFLNAHPILKQNSEYEKLLSLWKNDRENFIGQYENCKNNIRRYRARLKHSPSNSDEALSSEQLLMQHEERASIFKKIFSNEPINSNL